MKAVGKIFRNITAHEPERDWHKISKADAIEALTIVSYIHKRLDNVHDISYVRNNMICKKSN